MDIEEQLERKRAVKRKLEDKRGSPHYANMLLELWINGSEHSDGIPGAELVEADRGACHDCDERDVRRYVWMHWPAICAWCSFSRLENNGENTRVSRRAERLKEKLS